MEPLLTQMPCHVVLLLLLLFSPRGMYERARVDAAGGWEGSSSCGVFLRGCESCTLAAGEEKNKATTTLSLLSFFFETITFSFSRRLVVLRESSELIGRHDSLWKLGPPHHHHHHCRVQEVSYGKLTVAFGCSYFKQPGLTLFLLRFFFSPLPHIKKRCLKSLRLNSYKSALAVVLQFNLCKAPLCLNSFAMDG